MSDVTDLKAEVLTLRIENAELRRERKRAYNAGFDAGFASADDWLAQHEDAMVEHGWVRLPVDAGGEPIRIRDKVVEVDEPAVPRTVTGINLAGDGWWVYVNGVGRRSDKYRHHHAPTVEDVLREFADKYAFYSAIEGDIHPDLKAHEEVLRQFAAKLRLAGDGDE